MAGKKKMKMSKGDRIFTIINAVIMILVCIVVIYPLYYVLLASVTDPVVVNSGKLLLYPEAWYTEGYVTTLEYGPLWTAYKNTIVYTVVGTVVSLICTIPAGYALSRMDLVGRKPIMFLFTFTMFFQRRNDSPLSDHSAAAYLQYNLGDGASGSGFRLQPDCMPFRLRYERTH